MMLDEKNIVPQPKSLKIKKVAWTIAKIAFMILVLFITYFPIVLIAIFSFNRDGTGNNFTGWTFRWYIAMQKNEALVEAITYTLIITILSTIISTIFGTITAIGIHGMNKKNRKKMIMLNNIPILNADIVTGVFLFLIFQTIGRILGIEYILGFGTLLVAHILFSVPFVVLSVLPKLNEMDENMYDAALDLGCSPRQALFKVILPTIKSGVFAGSLLAFTMSIDDFVISYFVSGAEITNFSIWLYANRKMSHSNPMPQAYAYNTIISAATIIVLIIYIVVSRKKKEGKIK